MAHVSRNKKALLMRVRRIAGQVSALERAIGAGDDCGDVLTQVAAAKGAMHALMMEVLAGHMDEHVVAETDAARRAREAELVLKLMKRHG